MARAAREMTRAARESRHAVDLLTETQRPIVFGGLPEEEADRIATQVVREVRAEIFCERG